MKKNLLIATGGYADIPIIKAAKKLGFFVITSGLDERGLGIPYSDRYCKADNSDKEEILSLAKELNVVGICPGAAGNSANSCCYAAEQLGLNFIDSYDVAEILHNKEKFLKFAKKNNIPAPEAEGFDSSEQAIEAIDRFRFPIIIKPVDLSGGKGILKVTCKEEVESAILDAFDRSRIKKIVVEEFIEGSNHGLSTIIKDGRVVFYFCDNEYCYLNKYMVAGTFTPADVPQDAIEILTSGIEKIASLLKLKDGIFHLQFILRSDKPYIIDLCRRVPGDLYVKFVEYATGVDYSSAIVKAFAGLNIDGLKQKSPDGYHTRHVIMGNKNGTFESINFDPIIEENIIDKFMILEKGDKIENFMRQKMGIVFLKYGSKEEMDEKNARIHELIEAEIKD